ncbi:hypothetical protein MMC29_001350 [Sticta canariensis]|nr:hypothetical protein [Sticta canariensis]
MLGMLVSSLQMVCIAIHLNGRDPKAMRALRRSLCLIDEFGKGTLSNDGVGLLCASLQQFVKRPHSPKVIACTHYSEVLNERYLPRSSPCHLFWGTRYPTAASGIKHSRPCKVGKPKQRLEAAGMTVSARRNLLSRHPRLSFNTMNVLVERSEEGAAQVKSDIVFLYRLVPGWPPSMLIYSFQDCNTQRTWDQTLLESITPPAVHAPTSAANEQLHFSGGHAQGSPCTAGYAAPSFGVHCARLAGLAAAVLDRARQVQSSHCASP